MSTITTEQRRALARAYFADHCDPTEGPDAAALLATMPDAELLERFEVFAFEGDTDAAALLARLGLPLPTEHLHFPTEHDGPTPGPWKSAGGHVTATRRGELVTVATVPMGDDAGQRLKAGRKPQGVHDAQLIAAAPDLLAALHEALDEIDAAQADGYAPPAWAATARAVVAKATGGQA